ncbi:MAG TPA: ATP-binding protein [Terracidiphilus sp.]|jgi:two-component system sensor histidine kinase FlrB|nr:ATP-binding protein [Terracidiphilus sp.]
MLPSSHVIPIKGLGVDTLPNPQLLADAFSEFIAASSVLETSYRDLQEEVTRLSAELTRRNAALSSSIADNDRMRAALQQMVDSMPCGVLVLNHEARIVMINPESRRLLNLGAASVGSLHDLSALSRVDFDAISQGPSTLVESEVCVSSGAQKRWLAIGNRKLFCGPNHKPDHLHSIWILRDITANKQAELEREAARRATALAEVSTMLAHEIRNPLASMELFAGLIEQDLGASSQWISHLRAGIRRLSGTVNNVLSLKGESKPRLAPIDLSECVRAGVEFVQPIAEQAGLTVSFSASETLAIEGNDGAIHQVILNIVCNAIRHTEAGGTVEVSARRDGDRALVDIRDTGCGIPADIAEHIFEAGFSAAGETPGLGLAVCKRLMEQHRGAIKLTSRVDEGTTFHLEFPTL